jgi:threonine/homoserine/homoserine lactone efflux protein
LQRSIKSEPPLTKDIRHSRMTIIEAFVLFGTMAVLAAIPSASVALVIARAITFGTAHGIAVGIGIVIGDLIFMALVMLGLAYLAEAMGGTFMMFKYLGAFYLLWLGITLLRSNDNSPVTTKLRSQRGSFVASFFSGLLLTLGDVKAIFFYLSLLPMFIDFAALRRADALLVVVITIIAVGGVKILYAFFSFRVANSAWGQRFTTLSKKAAGAGLIGAGSYIVAN